MRIFVLDGHRSVVALHGVYDEFPLVQVGKEVYFHGVDVVTPRVETINKSLRLFREKGSFPIRMDDLFR
jgi:hypothetical protein